MDDRLIGGVLRTQLGDHLAAGRQVTLLRHGDEPLGEGAQALGLGQGGGDGAVLEEAGREVLQHHLLVRRAAAQARSLVGVGIVLFS